MRWQRLLLPLPQFITNRKSERIVEIGPCTFAKVIVKIEVTLFYLGHGVHTVHIIHVHTSSPDIR